MGSWHYHCALCGSTFEGAYYVSRKPRTARFLWRKQRDADFDAMVAAASNGKIDFRKFNEESAAGEKNFDDESLPSDEEDDLYDCDIISMEDAIWSLHLQCLGVNRDSPLLERAFLSDVGCSDSYGAVSAEPGSDPSAPDDLNEYSAYDLGDDEPLFPFHPKCFELFQQAVAFQRGFKVNANPLPNGDWDLVVPCRDLDKDALWEVFFNLKSDQRLEISYGEPEPPHDQYWLVNSGEELLIADPGKRNPLAVNAIGDAWREIDCPDSDPDIKSTEDPFAKLPFELVLLVTSELPSRSLLDLLQASPHLRRGLGPSFSFWKRQFEKKMPWFYEMHSFLRDLSSSDSQEAREAPGKLTSHFFAWAYHTTTPRRGLKGPFMGIANRRRIWEVCNQIVSPYLNQAKAEYSHSEVGEETQFRNSTVCLDMPVVTSPPLAHFHTERVF